MVILSDKVKEQVKEKFRKLEKEVELIVFTQEPPECEFCEANETLLKEVSELSEKIKLEIYLFRRNKEVAEKFKVDKIPAVIVTGEALNEEGRIRFFGAPLGYEFGVLIEDILDVSRGKTDLPEEILNELKKNKRRRSHTSVHHANLSVLPCCRKNRAQNGYRICQGNR